MNTLILKVDPENVAENTAAIEQAALIINSGGLVAFPTETVYGLGADGLNEEAVKKIYEAKGRPSDNPLILHISSPEEIPPLVKEIPEKAKLLMEAFWPGPMTLIFKKSDKVPLRVSGGLDTVAIRYPENKVARLLIKKSGTPIAAPSANTSGKPSPTRASHVEYDLKWKIDAIVDGGKCKFGLESTIVDVTGDVPCILRPGSVTPDMIKEVVGECDIDKAVLYGMSEGQKPKAPGMKYTHYSPLASVEIVKGDREKMCLEILKKARECRDKGHKCVILACEQTKDRYKDIDVLVWGDSNNPETIGANVFKMLRKCDYLGFDRVFAEGFEEKGVGLAVMNRLKKAAGYHITEV
ncbi:MAG: threonylcarbamoyl-AMP synthase [Firmicutes bacterium]|nr:threonylcarbamoyl-AMP synthase [Bacillota bacterium]